MQFFPSLMVIDVAKHKLGKEGKENLDIIIVTVLIV